MNAISKDVVLRIPMPIVDVGVNPQQWKVLTEAIWPSAKTTEGVMMAVDYCRVRKLDPFKRPVHIVPVWNSALGREVETVWPGINELQTTAARTGQWAGMDEPKWGPLVSQTFEGMVGKRGQERSVKVTLKFPEWCSVTVWRIVNGVRCAFCEPVYWIECYGRMGKTLVPNDMWQKRVRGQHHKVAKASSLRAAFPEETGNDYTAEEMEGQVIETGGVVIDHEPANHSNQTQPTAPPSIDYVELFQNRLARCTDADCVVKQGQAWSTAIAKAKEASRAIPDDVQNQINELLADALDRFAAPLPDYGEQDAEDVMPA